MNSLFSSVQVGALTLKNRIVMAPLTRTRAGETRAPNALMREYYMQRADAGMILTEATSITSRGVGYPRTPGVWSQEQIEGWKNVVEGVHQKGSKMILQLWHVGRISHSSYHNGALPVAPSAVQPAGHPSLLRPQVPYEIPHALTVAEIKDIIQDYKQAAINAKAAGFDGVEIHGANGYLPDQFLQSKTNLRTDEYGGSVENRARFLLEATDAVIEVWGADRVGVHLTPRGGSNDISDSNPQETFGYVARELKKRKIAFLFVRDPQTPGWLTPYLKQEFGGVVIANDSIKADQAEILIKEGVADMVSFGRDFISNPDLVERLKNKWPLAAINPDTLYLSGAEGYTDYSAYKK